MPWLLASVEDLGDSCGGQVWRWSLTGTEGDFCACSALTGRGTIPRLPFSVGFVPPATVVVAAQSRVVAIDAGDDRVVWEASYDLQPVDIFALEDTSARPMIAVAGATRFGGEIREVRLYDAAAGGSPIVRTLNTMDLPLGLSVAGMSQSPFNRQWFRVLRSDMYPAADIDPWANIRQSPFHTVPRDGFWLKTLHSSYDGTWHRTVWTGERTDVPESPSQVFTLAISDDTGSNTVPLGDTCDTGPDGSAYGVTCEYLHAVADPRLNTAAIALCQYGPSQRRIVRMSGIQRCWDVVEQTDGFADARISRIGLAQTTFWAP